jgi:hypothetical protein
MAGHALAPAEADAIVSLDVNHAGSSQRVVDPGRSLCEYPFGD